ncbi:SigE family RNA polymerase sigma factor [Phaeacidiphilus oryzae]|uniref:SigE family RNA polymerase sigma factor n=1 Tax=Phaeacidiphilus oryzae TaxID=348818 RepID=UPI0007C82A5D|nr:SigE family RNA polymerase sigma factor [Phaeacidiphilus oryzae]
MADDPGDGREPGRGPGQGHGDERGHGQDFDAFYAAAYRRLVGQVYAVTGSLAEAEDAVQEAFARAWQRWSRLNRGDGEPEAWVRTVACRLAVSSWRKSVNRSFAHQRDYQRSGEVPGLSPDHLALVEALRRISPDQRLAIVLHHFAELSVEEIAAETGARPGSVKSRLARGRRALEPYLREQADDRGGGASEGVKVRGNGRTRRVEQP